MRWSHLKKLLQDLFDPSLKLEVFCTVQRGEHGAIGRYWFVLDGETIWDEPKNVSAILRAGESNLDATTMSSIMRLYIDTPKDNLLEISSSNDKWGLLDLLKVVDRRIGARRLLKLKEEITNELALRIIDMRLER